MNTIFVSIAVSTVLDGITSPSLGPKSSFMCVTYIYLSAFVCDTYSSTTGINAVINKNIRQVLIFHDNSPDRGFPTVQESIDINLKSCYQKQ